MPLMLPRRVWRLNCTVVTKYHSSDEYYITGGDRQ